MKKMKHALIIFIIVIHHFMLAEGKEEEYIFLDIQEAKQFSMNMPISAKNARNLLEKKLIEDGGNYVTLRVYTAYCFVFNGKYYFLREDKLWRIDGYAVDAQTGEIQRIRVKKRIHHPYTSKEQKALFDN